MMGTVVGTSERAVDGWLEAWRLDTERALAARLDAFEGPARLREAMSYSVLAGGKRLRPLLCLAACDAVGAGAKVAMGPAVAVELVHTFSLIHDDLPAMDDDDLRRGRPTCHRAFGEAVALLAGDALLAEAFDAALDGLADAATGLRIVHELRRGTAGMVSGQILDLEGEGAHLGREALEHLHRNKTGALIVASLRMGAIAAGASDEALSALTSFGERIGLAFQVVDDLLDVVGDPARLGKGAHGDARHGKSTFAELLGVEGARAYSLELLATANAALEGGTLRTDRLRALAERAVHRES
jgi:geranylgeranyl pyrophosphate synthase